MGKDDPHCRNSTQNKCKTIDYALSQAKGDNITLVFQSSPIQSLNYTLTSRFPRKDNKSLILCLLKDNPHGMNPSIYGNAQPFIHNWKGDLTVLIKAVNMVNISLLSISAAEGEISISITNSSIHMSHSNFISVHEGNDLSINFQDCLLTSPYSYKGNEIIIDEYSWLKVEINTNSISKISINETKVRGGHFHFKNIASLRILKCSIHNNIPTVACELYVDLKSVGIYRLFPVNFMQLYPKLLGRIVTLTPQPVVLITESVFNLENVDDFVFENCTVEQTISKRILLMSKVNKGKIHNLHFIRNIHFLQATEAAQSTIQYTEVKVQGSLTGSLSSGMIKGSKKSTITIKDLTIIKSKFGDTVFHIIEESSILIERLKIDDLKNNGMKVFVILDSTLTVIGLQINEFEGEKIVSSTRDTHRTTVTLVNIVIKASTITSEYLTMHRTYFKLRKCNITDTNINTDIGDAFRLTKSSSVIENLIILGSSGKDLILVSLGNIDITNLTVSSSRFERGFIFDRSKRTEVNVKNLKLLDTVFTSDVFRIFQSIVQLSYMRILRCHLSVYLIHSTDKFEESFIPSWLKHRKKLNSLF